MLKYLNFQFLNDILNDNLGKPKSSFRSQMLYIRVIIKHFKALKPTILNLAPFKVTNSDLPWVTWEEPLEELQKLGLVVIEKSGHEHSYRFLNKWEAYIDKTNLTIPTNKNTIEKYEFEISTNDPIKTLLKIRDGIKDNEINRAFEMFFIEQKALDKEYENLVDAKTHFLHWVRVNKEYFSTPITNNSAKGTPIKKQN